MRNSLCLTAVLLLSVLLSSCSEDDPVRPPSAEQDPPPPVSAEDHSTRPDAPGVPADGDCVEPWRSAYAGEGLLHVCDTDSREWITGAEIILYPLVATRDREWMPPAGWMEWAPYAVEQYAEYRVFSDDDGVHVIDGFGNGPYVAHVYADGYLPLFNKQQHMYFGPEQGLVSSFMLRKTPDAITVDNRYANVFQVLEDNDIAPGYSNARTSALEEYDQLVRDEVAVAGEFTASVDIRDMMALRYQRLIQELKQPVSQLTIWKLANMGTLIKEGETIIGIDINKRYFEVVDRDLLSLIDAFWVTHEHIDHFDGHVANLARLYDVPYYVPAHMTERFAEGEFLAHNRFQVVEAIGISDNEVISLDGWTVEARSAVHSGSPLLTYLVTSPEGATVLHLGDGMPHITPSRWQEDLPQHYRDIDVLIPAIWLGAPIIDELMTQFNAKMLLPMHANELGHSGDYGTGRYPFSYAQDISATDKLVMMFYGDKVTLNTVSP